MTNGYPPVFLLFIFFYFSSKGIHMRLFIMYALSSVDEIFNASMMSLKTDIYKVSGTINPEIMRIFKYPVSNYQKQNEKCNIHSPSGTKESQKKKKSSHVALNIKDEKAIPGQPKKESSCGLQKLTIHMLSKKTSSARMSSTGSPHRTAGRGLAGSSRWAHSLCGTPKAAALTKSDRQRNLPTQAGAQESQTSSTYMVIKASLRTPRDQEGDVSWAAGGQVASHCHHPSSKCSSLQRRRRGTAKSSNNGPSDFSFTFFFFAEEKSIVVK